ncbi:Hypothetical predicted protein, partial [Pelobates cultripes]
MGSQHSSPLIAYDPSSTTDPPVVLNETHHPCNPVKSMKTHLPRPWTTPAAYIHACPYIGVWELLTTERQNLTLK